MYNVIVGTAGHVDHGKTCLVKALTGVDTDRLKEEKKRGITIELGFARLSNDKNLNIGVIDVPGHEKFIKNMLAGVGGIDLVLLIVAADEGIMPQTVEHFEILKMLGIKRGIVVITKADTVDEEWLEIVRDDINECVAGTFLEDAPVIEVSAYTGHNVSALKELICDMALTAKTRRSDSGFFRVPVDRVFTIDGFGTVVTGTLIEGAISLGDEVMVYPGKKTAKVRNLQVHGNAVDKAYAGQRTALNLTNIKKEELERGYVLAVKDSLELTMLLDVKLEMFKNSPRTLVSGSRVHLYYGAAETLCKVVLLDSEALESGQSGYAQLRLETEIAVKKGDRFILRFYSPVESIGGGVILHSNPPKRKRFQKEILQALEVKETGGTEEILEQIFLEESRKLLKSVEIQRLGSFDAEELAAGIKSLEERNRVISLSEDIVVHADYWEDASEKAAALLKTFHGENPFRPGMLKEEFRKRLGERLFLKNSRNVEMLMNKLIDGGLVTDSGNIISLEGFRVTYTPQDLILKGKIENEYRTRGKEAPETDEILSLFKENERQTVTELMEALRREGSLEKLAYNCYIHADCLADAVRLLKGFIAEKGCITLSEYRDLLGTSRKYAVRILEYLDQQRITELVDDARVLIA